MKRILSAALAAFLLASPALAVMPDEKLADPALEARAREISKELRCLVCQNQSIDDSNAELARDLRVLVRERLTAGDSNREALDFIHARYGDYVLLRPPVKPETWALWFGPAVVLVLAGAGSAAYLHRRRREETAGAATALSADEERRLEAMLARMDGPDAAADGDGGRKAGRPEDTVRS